MVNLQAAGAVAGSAIIAKTDSLVVVTIFVFAGIGSFVVDFQARVFQHSVAAGTGSQRTSGGERDP